MPRIQQLITTAKTRFNEASTRARVTGGICTVLVMFSLLSLIFRSSSSPMEPLLGNHDFTQSEITRLSQHFATAGLDHWELQGKQILIPKEQRTEYLTAVEGQIESQSLNSDVDTVLQGGSILDTPTLREMRLRNAQEKDLARIISQIPGIEEAQINIDDHQQRGLSGRKEMTALAAIKANPQSHVTLETSEAIREVIAARFAGLERNNVVVIDLNTGHTFGASDSNYNASNLDIALRNYERWWRGRIANLLIDIPNTRIEVGLYPVETKTAENSSEVNTVNATVSVGIPDSYIQQVAGSRKATTTVQRKAIAQEVKQNVTDLVQGVIPAVPHTTLDNFTVHVATILDIPTNPASSQSTTLITFLSSVWREIVMGLLFVACISVIAWRNQKLQAKSNILPPASSHASIPETGQIEDMVFVNHSAHHHLNGVPTEASKTNTIRTNTSIPPVIKETTSPNLKEPTLQDELNALVDEAPADAADILKKWISSTSS